MRYANAFDAILTTLNLPGCRADDLVEEIRRQNPLSPIILLTVDDLATHEITRMNDVHILHKTMGIAETMDTLNRVLA
jgi:DNA-binding response OmpR family regulator